MTTSWLTMTLVKLVTLILASLLVVAAMKRIQLLMSLALHLNLQEVTSFTIITPDPLHILAAAVKPLLIIHPFWYFTLPHQSNWSLSSVQAQYERLTQIFLKRK